MLDQIYSSADKYINSISSKQSLEGFNSLDVKNYRSVFKEAIVLVHINGSLSPRQLSDLVGYRLSPEHIDVISDYFLRDILNNQSKAKSGHDILSGRQLTRRRAKESARLNDQSILGDTYHSINRKRREPDKKAI